MSDERLRRKLEEEEPPFSQSSRILSREPTARSPEHPIPEWQEDVKPRIRAFVVGEVVRSCRAKAWRQPLAEVNAPVKFFGRKEVDRECD